MIRDRLLSFNVKNGNLSNLNLGRGGKQITINERTELLAQKQKRQTQMSSEKFEKRKARDM